jgi:hypothetical protein
MKKSIIFIAFISVLLISTNNSKAALGASTFTQAPPALMLFVIGGGFIKYGLENLGSECVNSRSCIFKSFLHSTMIVFGAILLDDNSGELNYKILTKEQALEMSITLKELQSFNDEVDELNALKEEISLKIHNIKDPHQKIINNKIQKNWLDYSMEGYISKDTYSALIKFQKFIASSLTK